VGFLRVLRLWTLVHSEIFWRTVGRRYDDTRVEDIVRAVATMLTFVFVITGFVYTSFAHRHEDIDGYLDALYFTVTTLTTTGYGDILLPGAWGRILSIVTMVVGITLFVRLAQAIFRPHKVRFRCNTCGLGVHDPDAVHCKACGELLNIPNDEALRPPSARACGLTRAAAGCRRAAMNVQAPNAANARVIRAPTGPERSCRSWQTEAALRMLMNNLDPDVAERPEDLVVYGGIGKAARNWDAFDRIVAALQRLEDDETLLVQSGKPVGRVPHPRRRAARADRQLEPGPPLGDMGAVPRARSGGADDVRPDDRRVLDIHRHPGHRSGHLRDVRGGGPAPLRRRPLRALVPDRGTGRHGRGPAAGGGDGGRVHAGHRVPAQPDRKAPADPLPRPGG
jgi:hypothetical protein